MKRLSLLLIFVMGGCQLEANRETEVPNEMNIQIGEVQGTIRLEANATALAFTERLPQTFQMNDLHENEKYVYVDQSFPTNPTKQEQVRAGDVMVYGDNCIVLFYKDVKTSVHYTKIGEVVDLDLGALFDGTDTVTVQFE